MAPTTKKLSAFEVRNAATVAVCHPRTVEKFLRGETVRDSVAVRIEVALEKLGYRSAEDAAPKDAA